MALDYAVDGGVGLITLNRPDVLNAFDDELGAAALDAVNEASNDSAVRCLVITGAGRAFCAGEDLGPLADDYKAGRAPRLGDTLVRRYNPLILAIRNAPKPVVAAINGVAAGAGVSLALACDFRIASDKARLSLAFIKVGLVPDSGAIWFLTRLVGSAKAFELCALGDPVSADDALSLGLINQVVPAEELEPAWQAFARRLADGPTRAIALTKTLANLAANTTLKDQLEGEVKAQTEAGLSEDHLEGVNAFFERRAAAFKGR